MARKRKNAGFRAASEAELVLLEMLWEAGPASPAELREKLAEQGDERAYTTVQTLLHRLLEKGYVARKKRGAALVYEARSSRDEVLLEHVDDLTERLCGGSTTPLLLNLVQSGRLSRKELARLREVLDGASAPQRRRARRSR